MYIYINSRYLFVDTQVAKTKTDTKFIIRHLIQPFLIFQSTCVQIYLGIFNCIRNELVSNINCDYDYLSWLNYFTMSNVIHL